MDKHGEQKVNEAVISKIKSYCKKLVTAINNAEDKLSGAPIFCGKLKEIGASNYLKKYAQYSQDVKKNLTIIYDENYKAFGKNYINWVIPYSGKYGLDDSETERKSCVQRIIEMFLNQALKYPGVKPGSPAAKLWDMPNLKPKIGGPFANFGKGTYETTNCFKDAMSMRDKWIKACQEKNENKEVHGWVHCNLPFDDIKKQFGNPPTKPILPLSLKETIVLWCFFASKHDLAIS